MDVMGLENTVQITEDIGAADAVLALRSKLKTNSWVRGMAKFRQLPIFAIKVSYLLVGMRWAFSPASVSYSPLLTLFLNTAGKYNGSDGESDACNFKHGVLRKWQIERRWWARYSRYPKIRVNQTVNPGRWDWCLRGEHLSNSQSFEISQVAGVVLYTYVVCSGQAKWFCWCVHSWLDLEAHCHLYLMTLT